MRKRLSVTLGVVLLAGLSGAAYTQISSSEPAREIIFRGEPITAAQLQSGKQLYADNCASCHGENLEGQPDWRRRLENGRMPAPPHSEEGHTWHHSDRVLFTITQLGVAGVVENYESDMPAFGEVLSEPEITAVLAYIKSAWPEQQAEFQSVVTANDAGGK